MLRDYHPVNDRDVVFIPVGINYDRVIEDRSLVRRLEKNVEKRSMWFVIKTSLSFIFKNALLSRKNRWRRFGYASVNFGEPISAKEYCKTNNLDFSVLQTEERFARVEYLAEEIMKNIEKVVPVLPVALMSKVLIENKNEWKSALELKTLGADKIEKLDKAGAPIDISSSALESVLGAALDALLGRGLLEDKESLYRMKSAEADIINYYANSIAHW
jgi:glycerol-3-phosphate O-acyltransferase